MASLSPSAEPGPSRSAGKAEHGDAAGECLTERGTQPLTASICGLGAVTGYGWGTKPLWEGLLAGESAVAIHGGFAPYLESDEAWLATIPEGGDPEDGPTRFTRSLRYAAREAIENAKSRGWEAGSSVGIVHGQVLGDVELWGDFHRTEARATRTLRERLNTSRRWVELMPSTVLSMLMIENGFHGPVMSVQAMCASGNAGLLTAKAWLDAGVVSDVLLLATDVSAVAENIRFFRDLGVLVVDGMSLDVCRPFQEGSRGFTGGEAAVAMIVSGSPDGSYGEVLGGAMSHDAFHAISISHDHDKILACFADALRNSGVESSEIRYLNAHGPGTMQCDLAEAHAFDEVLTGADGLFSVKPLTGHCQGAASAVEILATLYSFEHGVIPAPRQVAPGHPKLVDGPTLRQPGAVLKSSIGMGGHNSSIVLAEPATRV